MTLNTAMLASLVKAGATPAQLAALVGGTAKVKSAKGKAKGGNRPSKEEFEAALIEACKAKGYANPEPRFNILTYGKWTGY